MTEALNYTTKAVADLGALAAGGELCPADKSGVLFIQQLLARAEVFALPDAGELLDRSRPRPQVPGAVFHPPFPVVALEYRAIERPGAQPHPIYEAANSSKRIALAWEWDGRMPSGMTATDGPTVGEGVVIASVSYIDAAKTWIPMMGAVLIPYDCFYLADDNPNAVVRAFVDTGRITEKQARAEKIEIRAVLPIMGDALARAVRQGGLAYAFDCLQVDLMDEVNAYIDLMTALSCNNVSSVRHPQPERLNRARIKAGKAPLKDFHVLTIAGVDMPSAVGKARSSGGVRSHLRRGHIRRLGPERVTWVNSCMVRGSSAGFVDKTYSVGASA